MKARAKEKTPTTGDSGEPRIVLLGVSGLPAPSNKEIEFARAASSMAVNQAVVHLGRELKDALRGLGARSSGPTISVEGACELLGCQRRRVFQLLKSGHLERAPRHGKSLRILKAGVERLAVEAPPKKRRKQRAPSFTPARLSEIPVFER